MHNAVEHAQNEARTALIGGLNQLLVELYALSLKTKNFHWCANGPSLGDLRRLCSDQAMELFTETDLVAEQLSRHDCEVETSIGAVADRSHAAGQSEGRYCATDLIAELVEDNRTLITLLHKTRGLAENAGDGQTDQAIPDWIEQAGQRVDLLEKLRKNSTITDA